MTGTVEKKRKQLHYKSVLLKGDRTLQEYLEEALGELEYVSQRQEEISESGLFRIINEAQTRGNMTFGELLLYEPGRDQQAIVTGARQKKLPVEAIPAGTSKDGKPREFLESVLYFGVLKNHVVLLQSMALRADTLQAHLNWLLRDQTTKLPDDSIVILTDSVNQQIRKRVAKDPIHEIRIGGNPVQSKAEVASPSEGTEKATSVVPTGRGVDLLAAVFGPEWWKKVRLSDALDESNLDVELRVRYLRKTNSEGMRLLETVGHAARDFVDPDALQIDLKSGATIRGGELKLRETVQLETLNGIPDRSKLYDAMEAWLRRCFEEGIIA